MEDIMKMNVPDTTGGAKGRYKIQLFDANTNELLEETECNNMINPAFGTIGYHLFYLQMQFANDWDITHLLDATNPDGMQSGYCSTLSIVNTDYSPEQHPYGFPDCDTLCKTNLFKADITESSVRANINLNESYNRVEFDDSGKMVYRRHIVVDYATHQGNGTFNSIIISPCGLNMFRRTRGGFISPNSGEHNAYRDKSIGSFPYARINEENIGTSLSGSSDYGNVSVESAGIFWTCNSAGSFKKTSSSSAQNNNWDNLTFYRWDVTDGTIKLTKTVKLSGTPEDLLNHLGTGYYLVGCYFQGKFYVEATSKSSPYGYTCYIFNSEGVYEKSITWERTYGSSGVSIGYGYLDFAHGVFVALPQCVIQCRRYENNYNGMLLNIFGVDGSPIKQLSRDEYRQLIHELYKNAFNAPDYALSNIDTRLVKFVPFTQPDGKTIAMVCYCSNDRINNTIGYYDPETNDFKPFESALMWYHPDTYVSSIFEGVYVYQNSAYSTTSSGLLVSGVIPWWSWCKLPKSVTKTSSTTMKIQYDIIMDYVPPFSPAITTK